MAIRNSDMNAEPGCGWATDSDMAGVAEWAHMELWTQMAARVSQFCRVPPTVQSLDTSMATDPGHQCGQEVKLSLLADNMMNT